MGDKSLGRAADGPAGQCELCKITSVEWNEQTGKTLLACGRCGKVMYCTKAHQKQDWRRHKTVCGKAAVPHFCAFCGVSHNGLACGKCRMVGYCSKAHQQKHWSVHRKDCAIVARVPFVHPGDTVPLLDVEDGPTVKPTVRTNYQLFQRAFMFRYGVNVEQCHATAVAELGEVLGMACLNDYLAASPTDRFSFAEKLLRQVETDWVWWCARLFSPPNVFTRLPSALVNRILSLVTGVTGTRSVTRSPMLVCRYFYNVLRSYPRPAISLPAGSFTKDVARHIGMMFRPMLLEVDDDACAQGKMGSGLRLIHSYNPGLKRLSLSCEGVGEDKHVLAVAKLTGLVSLYLNAHVSTDSWMALTALTGLRSFSFQSGYTNLDQVLQHPTKFCELLSAFPRLRTLSVSFSNGFSDPGPNLSQDLRSVYLHNTGISDAGLLNLSSCVSLTKLSVMNEDDDVWHAQDPPTGQGLGHITRLTGLRKLVLFDSALTDSVLAQFTSLTRLRDLTLHHTSVTRAGVQSLIGVLTQLEVDGNWA